MQNQVLPVAMKQFVFAYVNVAKTISRPTATGTRFAFARKSDLHSVIDATGNRNFQINFFGNLSLPATIGARFHDDFSSAAADRAGCLHPQDSGGLKHLSAAAALLTSLGLSARFTTTAVTSATCGWTLELDRFGHATGRLL